MSKSLVKRTRNTTGNVIVTELAGNHYLYGLPYGEAPKWSLVGFLPDIAGAITEPGFYSKPHRFGPYMEHDTVGVPVFDY